MRLIGKILFWLFSGLLTLALVLSAVAWYFAWHRPYNLNMYTNKVMIDFARSSPELLTQLGFIDNTPFDRHSGKLGNYTYEQDQIDLARIQKARDGLNRYGPDALDGQELITWRVMAWFLDDQLAQAEYEHSGYRINQISGVTINMPTFLTNTHAIVSKKSAERYISRLKEFGRVLEEVRIRVEDDRANGVIPPDFIINGALNGMRSFIEGGVEENPLYTTLPDRLKGIELSDDEKAALTADAKAAITEHVIPGYQNMIALFEDMLRETDHNAGIWRIPDGDRIYELALRSNTTTEMSASEIHEIGLSEVQRIEWEMDAILKSEGLAEGTVAERVQMLMQDPQHIFPNTDEGRAEMIAYLEEIDDALMAKAPDFFKTLPPQELKIVRIPEFAQDSAPGGYYNAPALDGSRPGQFFINQKNTADNPRWTLPTLMYHEAAPGHHFQISLALNIEGLPIIRTMPLFSAYAEGWALYAERIVKTDMGMYDEDPLGDLGRLQAEMFRAVRLVVDTGMHDKRWSREQAIDYMVSKTGMTEAEVTREIERYVVWPGQATSYKTGQLAILELRANAEAALGDDFDLREFHDVLIGNGAMPLGILEDLVNDWIREQQAG